MRNEGETGVTVKVQEIDVMKVDKFNYLGSTTKSNRWSTKSGEKVSAGSVRGDL